MAHRLPLADIEFIASFAAFCRTKGDKGYDYCDIENCALTQFTRGTCIHDNEQLPCGLVKLEVWQPFKGPLLDAILGGDRTFSALADRLEALLVDAPVVAR